MLFDKKRGKPKNLDPLRQLLDPSLLEFAEAELIPIYQQHTIPIFRYSFDHSYY